MEKSDGNAKGNFIRDIIEGYLGEDGHTEIVTRFPPEPNGYLHIGHSKAICINFGMAAEYGGRTHLRFDDTNPEKEDVEYVESIMEDIRWLGFDWGDHLHYASDYFDQLHAWAMELIEAGKAFVCEQTAEEIRACRGSLTEPGTASPCRDRSVEENLDLFRRMTDGEFPDGSHTLRAKIDMAHPNLNMRDPVMYRIKRATHHRTGDKWCIYPMYDWTHGLSDAIEGITHSMCSLEFENHRPLYDWFIENVSAPCHPRQVEFARLNLNFTVMSKRKLIRLVEEGHVTGWDDPRMSTLAGYRRRGYTAEAIRSFIDEVGVAKANSIVDIGMLEAAIRDDLNPKTKRVMSVLRPLKLVITNYPEDQVEEFDVPFFPDDPPKMGSRKVPFCREIYIEADDFMEDPPRKFFRLSPGREVRLRRAYYVTCTDVVKDESGAVVEVHCTYDPESRGGTTEDGRRVKGTLHWVSARHAVDAEVRLYDRLFTVEDPDGHEGKEFVDFLNPESLERITNAKVEPVVAETEAGTRFQFERMGYFIADGVDHGKTGPVFNRIVPLRDGWAKILKQQQAQKAAREAQMKGKKKGA